MEPVILNDLAKGQAEVVCSAGEGKDPFWTETGVCVAFLAWFITKCLQTTPQRANTGDPSLSDACACQTVCSRRRPWFSLSGNQILIRYSYRLSFLAKTPVGAQDSWPSVDVMTSVFFIALITISYFELYKCTITCGGNGDIKEVSWCCL